MRLSSHNSRGRRPHAAASWLAATSVWLLVLSATANSAAGILTGTLTSSEAASLGTLGVTCAGTLAWLSSGHVGPGWRVPYQLSAAGLLTFVAGVAVAILLPTSHGASVATAALVASACVFVAALLRLPDRTLDISAQLRRGLDGFFVGVCLLFGLWLIVIRPWYEASRTDIASIDLLVVLPAMFAPVLLGIGVTTSLRLSRSRGRLLLLCLAQVFVYTTGVGLVAAWQWGPSAVATLWWMVVWIIAATSLIGVALLARAQIAQRAGARRTVLHHFALASGAAIATTAFFHHGASTGPLPLDAALLALLGICALGARLLLTYFDVQRGASILIDRESRYRAIVGASSDIMMVLDNHLRLTWAAAGSTWTSLTANDAAIGRQFTDLLHPEDQPQAAALLQGLLDGSIRERRVAIDARIRDDNDEWRYTESIVTDQRAHPHVRGLVVRTVEVSVRRSLEAELARLAYTDSLTGLANRRSLLQTLQGTVVGDHTQPVVLLALDLDGFKNVNDTQGHAMGDELLNEVAIQLKERVRPTSVVARVGGDEFAVLLRMTNREAREWAEQVLHAISRPVQLSDETTVFITGSIGLASSAPGMTPEDLMRNADLALRAAKQAGKNRVESYDFAFEERVRRRMEVTQELRGAIERDELSLVFQPVYSLPDRRIVGAEALMRWENSKLGRISPGEFIPAATEAGFTHELAIWTVRQVSAQLGQWKADQHSAWISINVSVRDLHTSRFATAVNQALIEQGVPASRLVIEVTEHDFSNHMETLIAQLSALRGTGVRIAMDDFGSGYSSLGQLHRLPIDILKIDRDIISEDSGAPAPLAEITVQLGRQLGMEVIGEGVESVRQLRTLEKAKCPMVQGYYFARPMPAEELQRLLLEQRPSTIPA
ncbi:EAL domain-containing protein [Natronoglycomyces albus]|uniref:EAL domain-containing protein n=1 Tax=Natronoglycomyces albus TaxID=2811108 RepID=A0A895XM31_9ACTN|nr:EAL domain-containing protein [Natronoglycomyces albus]QSB06404.1 EAL domain-containing protein [Natronoglycomyces albus]